MTRCFQNSAFRSGNVFDDILALCERANPMLHEIFPSPQQVMQKLLLNVFHGKLQVQQPGSGFTLSTLCFRRQFWRSSRRQRRTRKPTSAAFTNSTRSTLLK